MSIDINPGPEIPTIDEFPPETISPRDQTRQWAQAARPFARPDAFRSTVQLLNTVVPLAALWWAMLYAAEDAYWLSLLLSVPAAAFTIRIFIIQHDCGHRSFYRSSALNDYIGTVIGITTLTPHEYWRRAHNIHHAACGNLERRGIGDITLLTVAEYQALPRWQQLGYRIYRTPVMLFLIGPLYVFFFKFRLPLDLVLREPRLLVSVMATNLGIAGAVMGLSVAFGFINVLLVLFPVILLTAAVGVWLFYVQHQFEGTYWKENEGWDLHEASVMASSYYDLPQPLRWFSGNVGIHHIHHLSCRIPNYRLSDCLYEIPALQVVNRIGLRQSLSCIPLSLWDEQAQRLISFSTLKQRANT